MLQNIVSVTGRFGPVSVSIRQNQSTLTERAFTLNLLNLSVLFLFNVAQRFTLVFTPETLNLDGLTQT